MAAQDRLMTSLGLLSAYCLAGCLMEHFVVFYSWTLTTSPAELKRIQTPTGMRTLYVYIVPKTITTVLTGYLAWSTGEQWLKYCVGFLTVSWVSSFTVQVPTQRRIQRTGDREALEWLVLTDWVRVLSMVSHCGVVFWTCLEQSR